MDQETWDRFTETIKAHCGETKSPLAERYSASIDAAMVDINDGLAILDLAVKHLTTNEDINVSSTAREMERLVNQLRTLQSKIA